MLYIYFDSSALVKRYTPEIGSNLVNELFTAHTRTQIVCSILSIIETVSIFVRKRNDKRISQLAYEQALVEFQVELIDNDEIQKTSARNSIVIAALTFLERHSINASDAVILRSALDVQQLLHASGDTLLFCAADKRLLRAAQGEGLMTFNPEDDAQERLQRLLAAALPSEEPQ